MAWVCRFDCPAEILSNGATWSNIQCVLFKAYEEERNSYYQLIRDRADIFKEEAAQVGLLMLPYRGGFFITIPTDSANAICEELKERTRLCYCFS